MKIYKSTLKKLIIECINEVLEGGPGSGVKGHKTQRSEKAKENIDYDGNRKQQAEDEQKYGIKFIKDPDSPYSYNIVGSKDKIKKFLINHYSGVSDAKELHPDVFTK